MCRTYFPVSLVPVGSQDDSLSFGNTGCPLDLLPQLGQSFQGIGFPEQLVAGANEHEVYMYFRYSARDIAHWWESLGTPFNLGEGYAPYFF
jgi:hypothetical protein